MVPMSQAKPTPKQKETEPIVRLGDVRELTGSDSNGSDTDDGSLSGYQRKMGS